MNYWDAFCSQVLLSKFILSTQGKISRQFTHVISPFSFSITGHCLPFSCKICVEEFFIKHSFFHIYLFLEFTNTLPLILIVVL